MKKTDKLKRYITNKKETKGITLIALVITIIILLILAGISIAMLTGENGILKKAQESKNTTVYKSDIENIKLAYSTMKMYEGKTAEDLEQHIAEYIDGNIKVTLEDNGIYYIEISSGKYKLNPTTGEVTIDNGNEEKTEISAKDVTTDMYGKTVNYNVEVTNNATKEKENINSWKIFYADDNNIYLISTDYINCSLLATTTLNGQKTEHQVTWSTGDLQNPKAKFNNVLQDYTGASSITDTNPAKKWLSKYFEKRYSASNNNMKAVAYMLDTLAWSEYANDYAEYAIGGPTLELFVASYNKTHSEKIEIEASSESGYRLKRAEDKEMQNYLSGFKIGEDLYIPEYKDGVKTMWLATPSNSSGEEIMAVYSGCDNTSEGGYISNNYTSNEDNGFKPIICLKNIVKLEKAKEVYDYTIAK